jgi:predicted enzyme related to lactoylglutathione lyase
LQGQGGDQQAAAKPGYRLPPRPWFHGFALGHLTHSIEKVYFGKAPFGLCHTCMNLLINIDVSDIARAVAFYTEAFGLTVTRRFGDVGAELSGWPVRVYLLQKPAGSCGAAESLRRYDRHWTPVHIDVVVDDVAAAVSRAVAAGAQAETDIRTEIWGKIAVLADPFGHGFCLIEFLGRGYDEISDPSILQS